MALVGNLKDIKLPTLVQINCMEKNTAKLTIEHLGKFGFIYFDGGQVVHAEYDPLIGEEAFFKLLELYSGNFKVENDVKPPAVTIQRNWNNLLLEGLHRRDVNMPDSKFNFTRLFESLFNVKGVEQVSILDKHGNTIAQSDQQKINVTETLFFWYEAEKLSGVVGEHTLRFLRLSLGSKQQFVIQLDENYILVINFSKKIQQELIFSIIRETLKISV
ncbi:DUF4388 domain-containing protein [Calditrichota bacterium LG25]